MFGHNEGGNLIYAQIIDGKFAVRKTAEEALDANGKLTPNFRKRTLQKGANAGSEVYEWVFDSMTGKISRIEVKESDFGKQLGVNITGADGTTVVLTVSLKNDSGSLTAPASSFGDQIGMIDLSREISLGLSKKDGKVRGVAFSQDGTYIPNTKENADFAAHIANRPQPTEVPDPLEGGKLVKDWRAPSLWQYNQIQAAIDKLVKAGVGVTSSSPAPAASTTGTVTGTTTGTVTGTTATATVTPADEAAPVIPNLDDDLPF